jgi:IS1 family transposase
VIGSPEISTDGLHYYRPAIRDAFGKRATHGVINKTYSVTHLNVTEASRRYSPAQVVAVERVAVEGEPEHISTSYVERQNLSLRMASKRFARLSNGFSKKIDCHLAAVGLYVAFYNLSRTHETLSPSAKSPVTPAMAFGIADRVWTVAELIEAALKAVPIKPTPTPAQRRKSFRVIHGDLFD